MVLILPFVHFVGIHETIEYNVQNWEDINDIFHTYSQIYFHLFFQDVLYPKTNPAA